jgi:predicted metalloprotease with PDZ domain
MRHLTLTRITIPLSFAGLLLSAVPAIAQPAEPIDYTVSFPAPHTHYVDVVAEVPTDGAAKIELMMAVWTPGSYLVREFARHVENVRGQAPDGAALSVVKTQKNRWQITTEGHPRVIVSYQVYGREMSVRTNWVETDFAMLNGAPTFLTLADETEPRPHDVTLELPAHWYRSMTGLTPRQDRGPHSYRAVDFDTLVDTPIVTGDPAIYEFAVDEVPHLLVNVGESSVWHGSESARDVETLTREIRDLWGQLPYDRYLFLNMITEAGGGLEHRNSTLLMTSRWATSSRSRYLRWLALVSHELFHAWNVKQLRPVELGPFNYEREVHTESLWIVEGVTSYYDDLLVHRAGLSSREEYLEALSGQIESLQTTPGREVQPLALSSYDAWIKYYRADENSPNTSVSYYTKGAVVAFLLDMRIRTATGGARTLDDLLRTAYERYSGERGYTPAEFRATAAEVAGVDLSSWFQRAVDGIGELDYDEALQWLGLEFVGPQPDEEQGWVGLRARNAGGRLLVSQVRRDTPARTAGFNVDDEILAIGDHRVLPAEWNERIAAFASGTDLPVLIARRGELRELVVRVEAAPAEQWELAPIESPSRDQQERMDAWLGPEGEPQ